VISSPSPPYVWNAVVADHTVAFVESDSYGFPYLTGPQPAQSAVVKTLDLETGQVSAVPVGELSVPKSTRNYWPWWFLTAFPEGESGSGPSLVWATLNNPYSTIGVMHWQNLTGWNASTGTKELLNPEAMTLPPIRTGDILALPITSSAYEAAQGGAVGATLGEALLVLTASREAPIEVDPAAPVLPAPALEGVSPYVTWSGWLLGGAPSSDHAGQFRADLPGWPPRVFDLRSGEQIDINVDDPRTPDDWLASVVAGRWAAWVAIEGNPRGASLYLADLLTGEARRILDGDAPGRIALSDDWLLWTDASGNLLGYHLPDMVSVEVSGVVDSEESVRNLELSGDLTVLMVVNQESNVIGPDLPPRLTAVRVVRLR
jgi:hypothetical protein